MRKDKVSILVYCGLFIALVVIATAFLKVPTAIGYVNLGDGVIFASAAVLGPYAAVIGGVGSALADIMAGYTIYAPATLVIKGLMGFVVSKMIIDFSKNSARNIFVYIIAELLMVAGYFIFESFLYGVPLAAGSLISNLVQGAFGVIIAVILTPIIRRIFKTKLA